jgi:hypothetical protein
MAPVVVTEADIEHFDTHGWCVIPDVMSQDEAAAGRAMMDELLTADDCDPDGRRFQIRGTGPSAFPGWPTLSAAENGGPSRGGDITTRCDVMHPIHDARTALGVVASAQVVAPLLRSNGAGAGLRLIHQNWRRTLPTPPPEEGFPEYLPGQPGVLSAERAGLHMDTGFLPRHYQTTPRSSYVLSLLAFSPVVSGGAPFLVGPGTYAAARAASEALPPEYQASVNAKGCYQELRMVLMEQVGAARGQAMEATMKVGSLLVFDPMLSHQGSAFREGVTHATGVGRYAQFQVWADDAAIGDSLAGVPARGYSAPGRKY